MKAIKVGDKVKVMTGRDRGKIGEVLTIFGEKGKALIAGVNISKRHRKATADRPAGIVERESAIDLSNLRVLCPECQKPVRIGFKLEAKDKLRVCRNCDKALVTVKK